MKMKLIAGMCLTMSALAMVPSIALADADLEQRLIQMEKELNELKAIIRQQQQATDKKVQAVSEKVDTVVASKGTATESGFKTKKGTKFSYGGYIKVNGIFTKSSDGVGNSNVANSILQPAAIATGNGSGDGSTDFDADAFTSRFNFGTETDTSYGKVKTFIELDFLSSLGNEAVSNSTNPRIRHAFINWDYAEDQSLLVGQTWSTFFNVGALPDSVDFIGPTSGAIFNRQTQVRWTKKLGGGRSFQLAAENPASIVTGTSGIQDDGSIPDLVARYNGKYGGHSYSLAIVGRDVVVDNGFVDESQYGGAINIAGKYKINENNVLKYSLAHGNLGRYIALGAFSDGGIDATGDLDLSTVTGGYLALEHRWSEKLRSTIQYAYSTANLGDGTLATNTEEAQNYNISLVYNPLPKLDFGGALIFAERELENGDDGDLTRLQFTAKYSF